MPQVLATSAKAAATPQVARKPKSVKARPSKAGLEDKAREEKN